MNTIVLSLFAGHAGVFRSFYQTRAEKEEKAPFP
jgi:hypothetical protein